MNKRMMNRRLRSHKVALGVLGSVVLAVLAVGVTGCTLWKNAKETVSYAPMIYFDSKALRDVRNMSYFYLFDGNGLLVHDTVIPSERLQSDVSQLLVKNLYEGQYRLLTFSNVHQMIVPVVTRGVSKIEDVIIDSKSAAAHDSLRYHSSEHILEREKPVTASLQAAPCFYYMTVTVVGLEQLSKPLVNPSFKMYDLPSAIDGEGQPRSMNRIEVTPDLKVNEDGTLTSERIVLMRFNDVTQAKFQILSDGKNVQTSILKPSEFITLPSQTNVDVRVVFQPQRVTIMVNDWFAGSTDLVEMGE